jgi:hypothetical protein
MTDKQQIELHKKAEKALRAAVKKVVEEHKRIGAPLIVWKGGKVVHVTADKLKLNFR